MTIDSQFRRGKSVLHKCIASELVCVMYMYFYAWMWYCEHRTRVCNGMHSTYTYSFCLSRITIMHTLEFTKIDRNDLVSSVVVAVWLWESECCLITIQSKCKLFSHLSIKHKTNTGIKIFAKHFIMSWPIIMSLHPQFPLAVWMKEKSSNDHDTIPSLRIISSNILLYYYKFARHNEWISWFAITLSAQFFWTK